MDYTKLGYNQFMENNPYLDSDRYSSIQIQGLLPVGSVSIDKTFGQLLAERLADGSVTTAKIASLAVTNAKIATIEANKITSGEIIVLVDVGDGGTGYVRIDGENNRILVNDGTNDRILIGYQSGGF